MDFYPADWLLGTSAMSPEARGAYIDLICHSWDRGGCIPDDEDILIRLARVDRETWHRIRVDVLAKFIATSDGRLRHRRIDAEIRRAKTRSRIASENAKKGWDSRARGPTRVPGAHTHARENMPEDANTLKIEEKPASSRQCGGNANGHAENMLSTNYQLPQDSNPHSPSESAPPKARKKGSRISADWQPSEPAVKKCQEMGCVGEKLQLEYEGYLDWALSAGGSNAMKVDHDRAFVNWVRKEMKRVRETEERERRWAERRGQPRR